MTTINLGRSSLDEQIKFTLRDLTHLLVLWSSWSWKSVTKYRILWDILLQNTNKDVFLIVTDFMRIETLGRVFEETDSIKFCTSLESLDSQLDYVQYASELRRTFLSWIDYKSVDDYNKDIERWRYKNKNLYDLSLQEKKSYDVGEIKFWEKIKSIIVVLDEFQVVHNKQSTFEKVETLLNVWGNLDIKFILIWQYSQNSFPSSILSSFQNIICMKIFVDLRNLIEIENLHETLSFRWYGECLFYWDIFKSSIQYPLEKNRAIRWRINFISQEELKNIVDIFNTRSKYLSESGL